MSTNAAFNVDANASAGCGTDSPSQDRARSTNSQSSCLPALWYGAGALFGILFWSALIWLCL